MYIFLAILNLFGVLCSLFLVIDRTSDKKHFKAIFWSLIMWANLFLAITNIYKTINVKNTSEIINNATDTVVINDYVDTLFISHDKNVSINVKKL